MFDIQSRKAFVCVSALRPKNCQIISHSIIRWGIKMYARNFVFESYYCVSPIKDSTAYFNKKRRGGLRMRNSFQPLLPWCCYCADLIINSQFFPLWFRSVRSFFFLFLCINCYISLSWYFKPRFLLDMRQWSKLTDRLKIQLAWIY